MKKPCILLVMAAIAFGCGSKDKFLFNQVSTGLVVNPDTKTIVKNNTFVSATLDSSAAIHTLGSKVSFSSSDQFQHFSYATYSLPGAITPVNVFGNTVVFGSGAALTPSLYYSSDYGFHFDSIVNPVFNPAMSTSGYTSTDLIDVSYLDNTSLMVLYIQRVASNLHTKRLFKVNMTTKHADSVYAWQDKYSPVSMKFNNSQKGWMLLYSNTANGTFISRTNNGGATWTAPVAIDTKNMSILQSGTNGNMTVYEPLGNAFLSSDSGKTWKTPAADLKFSCIQKLSAAIAYGITTDGLIKSADSGKTWNVVSNNSLYEFANMKNLSFKDEQNGIIYGDQKMFITSDGGVTWKTLLYPYSYITN